MSGQPHHSAILVFLYRTVVGIVGLASLYLAAFLREDKEAKIQNRIEELSERIDRQANLTGKKAAAYFNNVASVVSRVFDRLFGRRLLSVQMVGVSSSLAFAGLFLTAGFMFGLFYHLLRRLPSIPQNLPANISADLSLLTVFCLILGVVFLAFALLPSAWPHPIARALSLVPVLLISFGAMRLGIRGATITMQLLLLGAVAASVLCDLGLLVFIRQSNRWIASTVSSARIAAATVGQIAVAALVVWLPFEVGTNLAIAFHWKILPDLLIWTALFNVFTGLAALILVLTLVGLLVHRAFWPFIGIVFYKLAQLKVVRNHRAMGMLSAVCLIVLCPSFRGVVGSALILAFLQFLSPPAPSS